MNDDRPRQKISIEDLLRIKRAERPPAEFWANFERELRAKQLAAIVEKRPWWNPLSRAFAGVARLHLPLGATAVLAVTFLTIREYRAPSADHDLSIPAAAPIMAPAAAAADETADAAVAPSARASIATPVAAEQTPRPAALAAEPVVSVVKPGEIGRVINGLSGSAPSDDSPRIANPSFRFLNTASLAAVQPIDAETVAAVVENAHGFESRGLPARMTEPLAQLPTPQAVSMRNRYLGTALSYGYPVETTASSPGRLINRIDGSKLHPDDFGRFETHGDSLSIKL